MRFTNYQEYKTAQNLGLILLSDALLFTATTSVFFFRLFLCGCKSAFLLKSRVTLDLLFFFFLMGIFGAYKSVKINKTLLRSILEYSLDY